MSVFIRFIYSKSFVCDAFWAVILELLFVNDLSGKKKNKRKIGTGIKMGFRHFFYLISSCFFLFFLNLYLFSSLVRVSSTFFCEAGSVARAGKKIIETSGELRQLWFR